MARHRFHGSPERFKTVATFIENHYQGSVTYIADVAGGQGMLSRMLNKKGYAAEVIDPRGWTMVGVPARREKYTADMADYYDLIIGLHPDKALPQVVESAKKRPIIVVPCCNFWDRTRKLGRDALLREIEVYFLNNKIQFRRVLFEFDGPQNIGLMTTR